MNPEFGEDPPAAALRTHPDAYPAFRSPLSFNEELQASVEFHLAALKSLAGGEPVVVLTFDAEWDGDGVPGSDLFDVVPDLPRERWLSWVEPEDYEDNGVITHGSRTVMTVDDPQLETLMAAAANGASITVTAVDLSWVARTREEFIQLTFFDPAVAETVEAARRDVWHRWGTDHPTGPLINLSLVRDHFEHRRQDWERQGVEVVAGPQYRTYTDGVLSSVEEPPEDIGLVDCFLINLASTGRGASARATVIVHDTGTCTIQVNFTHDADEHWEWDDPYGDSLRQRHQHAGSLDLAAVLATMEHTVEVITPNAQSWYSGLPRTPTPQV